MRCYAAVLAALVLAFFADTFLLRIVRMGPFSAFYCVVIVATWCGGLLLGLIATVISAVLVSVVILGGLTRALTIEPHALLVTFSIVSIAFGVVVAYAQIKRKMAEENGSLARAVVDSASDAIFVKDVGGRYLMINRAGASFVTKSVEEVIGQDDSQLFSVADAQRVKSFDREIMIRGEARNVEESVVIEGRERFFLTTKVPYRNGEGDVIGVVGISHEVTEQKREDRNSRFLNEATALLGSSLEYGATVAAVVRSAVPTLGDGCSVHIIDEETGALEMLAAYHRDPVRVAAAWELEKRYPPLPDSPVGAPAVIRSGEPELVSELDDAALRAFARDPEHLSILRSFGVRSFLCVPMEARGRRLGAMIFAMVESGRRYQAEDIPLATEIARRAAIAIDHAKMYELARQAVAVREDFLSIASHELKTPLTALQLSVQRLLRGTGTDGSLGRSAASMLATVERSTRRLAQLVDDLLDISRIVSQKTAFEREDVDLFTVVPKVVSDAQDMLSKAGCSVTVIGDGDASGYWNRDRLRLVMNNLLSNAAKYGPGKPIELAVVPAKSSVQISVTDHGIGIAKEMQSRIFERFERAVSEREYGGFGLGLWIVKQIVEGFGGMVDVASEPGQGSTFTVILPRNPLPPPTADLRGEPMMGQELGDVRLSP
jgi:PAS domain S-box-containing protein